MYLNDFRPPSSRIIKAFWQGWPLMRHDDDSFFDDEDAEVFEWAMWAAAFGFCTGLIIGALMY